MSYLTTAALKATLSIGSTYADADIQQAINSASRAIDFLCKRRGTSSRFAFEQDADANQVRYYSPERVTMLEIDDLVTLTQLVTDPSGDNTFPETWTLHTDFDLEPLNADSEGRPFTRLRVRPSGSFLFPVDYPRSVRLTGKFGWAAIPDGVVEATSIIASKMLKRAREAPYGVIAVNMDGAAVRIARSDPDVMLAIGDYQRRKIVVG